MLSAWYTVGLPVPTESWLVTPFSFQSQVNTEVTREAPALSVNEGRYRQSLHPPGGLREHILRVRASWRLRALAHPLPNAGLGCSPRDLSYWCEGGQLGGQRTLGRLPPVRGFLWGGTVRMGERWHMVSPWVGLLAEQGL